MTCTLLNIWVGTVFYIFSSWSLVAPGSLPQSTKSGHLHKDNDEKRWGLCTWWVPVQLVPTCSNLKAAAIIPVIVFTQCLDRHQWRIFELLFHSQSIRQIPLRSDELETNIISFLLSVAAAAAEAMLNMLKSSQDRQRTYNPRNQLLSKV